LPFIRLSCMCDLTHNVWWTYLCLLGFFYPFLLIFFIHPSIFGLLENNIMFIFYLLSMRLFHHHDSSHKFGMLSLIDFRSFILGFFILLFNMNELVWNWASYFFFGKHSFYIGHQSIFFFNLIHLLALFFLSCN
jgi:hypothetical protein